MIPHVFAQQSTDPCGVTKFDCYQETGFRLTSKPVVCIDMLSDPTTGHKLNIYAINDVEEWDPNAQIISSKSSPLCNITLEFLLKPLPDEQASVSDAVGVTYYDYEDHIAQIQIFCDAISLDSNGNSYFTDSIAPDYQLQWTIKHELGHAFGLGHYILTEDEINSWYYGTYLESPSGPPSIMLPMISVGTTVSPSFFKGDITSMDMNQLQSLYPNGFVQSSALANTNVTSIPTMKMSSSDIAYWTPIIRDYFKNSTNTISSSDYGTHVLDLVDVFDSKQLTSIPDPVDNQTNVTFWMQMPSWVSNDFSWWANGMISDNDLASSMQSLYDNKIFCFSLSLPPMHQVNALTWSNEGSICN